MAYAFDNTMGALNGQDPSQSNTNIFQQQPQGQTGQQQGGQQPGTSPSTVQVASTGGDLSGSQGSSAKSGSANQDAAQTQATNSIFSQNAGKTQAPIDTQQLTSDITTAKGKLQDEANAYVSSAAAPYNGGKLDQATQTGINDFISTGNLPPPSAATVASTYNPDGTPATQPTPSWFDLFKGGPTAVGAFNPTTNTNFANADLLSTNAGVGQMLRQRNDPEYSAGEANLDTALLNRNQNFTQGRAAALQAAQDLQKTQTNLTTNVQDQAQTARAAAAKDYQDAVRAKLEGGASADVSSAQAAKDAYDKAAAGLSKSDFEQTAAKDAYGTMNYDPQLQPYMSQMGDLDQYVRSNYNPNNTRWQDFATGAGANSYNAIESALGGGGSVLSGPGKYAGAAPTASDIFGFDKAAYQNDMMAHAKQLQMNYQAVKDQQNKADLDQQQHNQEMDQFNAEHPASPVDQGMGPGQLAIGSQPGTITLPPPQTGPATVIDEDGRIKTGFQPGQVALAT